MVTGAPDRGGGRRGGSGAGRYGRTGGRNHVWQPVGHRGAGGERGGEEGDARGGSGGGREGAADGWRGRGKGSGDGGEGSSSNWDRAADKGWEELDPTGWRHREEMNPDRKHDKDEEPGILQNPQQQDQIPKGEELTGKQNPASCYGCKCHGLKNHASENCNRRMHCELCGLNNHTSFECKREPLWNCAPELCAAQAFSRRSSLYELIGDYDQAANDVRRLITLLEKQLQENMSMPLEKTESIRSNLNQSIIRLSSLKLDTRKEASSNMYLILGIEPSSSAVDIKKAYHKAALRHHPDKAGKFLARSENISDAVWREITNEIRRDADYLLKTIGKSYSMLSDHTI